MSYYDPEDLKKFGEVGGFAKNLMDKFFDYYNAATSEEGSLTKREKALIALAVAHSKQCPYCIESCTDKCVETGAGPEEMTEAVHVAASMEAGVKLIHAVQMRKTMKKNGAL